ncbi:MAG TPA: hypothetical protein VEO95_09545 [Chthoniobacteraceae bacterium]|nr:hypothetical protein [Chthoniobacteraceae bacterium]
MKSIGKFAAFTVLAAVASTSALAGTPPHGRGHSENGPDKPSVSREKPPGDEDHDHDNNGKGHDEDHDHDKFEGDKDKGHNGHHGGDEDDD